MASSREPRCFPAESPRRLLSAAVAAIALAIALAPVSACAPERKDAPLRSPSRDYPRPPVTTSDGKVVGADNKPPEDWMGEHATSGGLAPGWSGTERGLTHDPARRVGGAVSQPLPASSSTPDDRCKRAREARRGASPRLSREDDVVEPGCDDGR